MKSFLGKNLRLKAVALGFAIALWFFVAGQRDTEVGLLVPLGYKSVPKNMVMTGTPPGEIEVRVVGPKLIVTNLSPSQLTAELDLSGAQKGRNTFKILPGDIVTPMGVEVTRVKPVSINIKMEPIVSVDLPVKVKLAGKPMEGFRVSQVLTEPEKVSVEGIQKELNGLKYLSTKPVEIEGADTTRVVLATLDTPDRDLRGFSHAKVTVRVIIEKEKQDK